MIPLSNLSMNKDDLSNA